MKGIFVVLSGVSDEPSRLLGQITPLQAAKTPNFDELAKQSKLDYCFSVKEGVVPESSSAAVSLLGYDPNFISRGSLEAIGSGIDLKPGDLALMTNFATIDGFDTKNILDRRAGRTLTWKEARILAKAINQKVKLPYKFEFKPTQHHRGVLVVKGGFSDNITGIDPSHDNNGMVITNSSGKFNFSKAMDDDDESKLAADVVNNFIKQSHEILDKHPLNINRVKKGLYSANFILCRGAGSELPKIKKIKGDWMALGYNSLDSGIAKYLKMNLYRVGYPSLKGLDVYSNLNTGLKKAIKHSIKMLKKYKAKHDYFYINFRELNSAGLDNKPLEKVKMIELLDRRFISFLNGFVRKNNLKLVITGDHTTSSKRKSHMDLPVPVLFYSDDNEKSQEKRFTEEQAILGRKISGRKLLERTLFSR